MSAVAISLFIVLYVLMLNILNDLYIVVAYLTSMGLSRWEVDYQELENSRSLWHLHGYGRSAAMVFGAFIVLTFLFSLGAAPPSWSATAAGVNIAALLIGVVIISLGVSRRLISFRTITEWEDEWKAVVDKYNTCSLHVMRHSVLDGRRLPAVTASATLLSKSVNADYATQTIRIAVRVTNTGDAGVVIVRAELQLCTTVEVSFITQRVCLSQSFKAEFSSGNAASAQITVAPGEGNSVTLTFHIPDFDDRRLHEFDVMYVHLIELNDGIEVAHEVLVDLPADGNQSTRPATQLVTGE